MGVLLVVIIFYLLFGTKTGFKEMDIEFEKINFKEN